MMNDLRNYYLQNLGIGEIWQERFLVADTISDTVANTATNADAQIADGASTVAEEIRHEKPDSWKMLQDGIRQCDACSQCRLFGKTTQLPVDRGAGDGVLDVLLVTEFAGPAEINRSEKLFDNIVIALSDQRDIRVRRTSVLKARALHGESSRSQISSSDIASCKHFLEQEIRLTQARVLLLFGEIAASAVLAHDDALEFTSLRKMQHNYQDIPVIVTYSSDEILLNPKLKSEVWADLCRLRKIL